MNYKVKIVDASIGTEIERDMTSEEIALLQSENAAYAIDKQNQIIEFERLRDLKLSAYSKLGLTDEEIEALIGKPAERIPL
jgi:hypothetical protein